MSERPTDEKDSARPLTINEGGAVHLEIYVSREDIMGVFASVDRLIEMDLTDEIMFEIASELRGLLVKYNAFSEGVYEATESVLKKHGLWGGD